MGSVPERKRTRKASKKRYVPVRPIVDNTTSYDTLTRKELMRLREEEIEKFRNAKAKQSKS